MLRRRQSLERWRPTLFLVGGGLVVGHAAIRALEAFTTVTPPPDVFAPLGYLVALVGLVTLYPSLVDRSPYVTRIATVLAAIPLVGWSGFAVTGLLELVEVAPALVAPLPAEWFVVHMAALILTYGLFALACLRSGTLGRAVGLLLFAPPLLFIVMLAAAAVLGYSAVGAFVVGGAQAIVHVGVGAALWVRRPAVESAPAVDATTG